MMYGSWMSNQRRRISHRRTFQNFVYEWSWVARAALFLCGYSWMLILPSGYLFRNTWVDENALQPNSVKAHWDWPNVRNADKYLESMEAIKDRNGSRSEYTSFILREFRALGMPAASQSYTISRGTDASDSGVNIYAHLPSPRAKGVEAIILSASWESLSFVDGSESVRNSNFRAIAMLLAAAKQYKAYSYWAKDIIFVINDGYLEGMHAFLSAYHRVKTPSGLPQSAPLFPNHQGLDIEPLQNIGGGVVWAAICLDYPGHSFSELGIFYEGINGRLPNQDLINSLSLISQYTGNVQIALYDGGADELRARVSGALPPIFRGSVFIDYILRALQICRHMGYQASGRPSGVHGLFHQYRIDAVTLFAVPAPGPHGFHALGKIMESSLRTVNNLLERLHASFFFYMLAGPDGFIVIGKYLTSAVLVGIGLELNGLQRWVASGWLQTQAGSAWRRVSRPTLTALAIMIATQLVGLLFSVLIAGGFLFHGCNTSRSLLVISVTTWAVPYLVAFILRRSLDFDGRTTSSVLTSFTLCIAGTVVCLVSVLNFSLAAASSIAFGLVLPFRMPPMRGTITKLLHHSFISLFAPTSVAWLTSLAIGNDLVTRNITQAIWEWKVLRVWTLPFILCIYFPLVLQASVAVILA